MIIRRRTNRSFIINILLLSQPSKETKEKREKRNREQHFETTLSRALSLSLCASFVSILLWFN